MHLTVNGCSEINRTWWFERLLFILKHRVSVSLSRAGWNIALGNRIVPCPLMPRNWHIRQISCCQIGFKAGVGRMFFRNALYAIVCAVSWCTVSSSVIVQETCWRSNKPKQKGSWFGCLTEATINAVPKPPLMLLPYATFLCFPFFSFSFLLLSSISYEFSLNGVIYLVERGLTLWMKFGCCPDITWWGCHLLITTISLDLSCPVLVTVIFIFRIIA